MSEVVREYSWQYKNKQSKPFQAYQPSYNVDNYDDDGPTNFAEEGIIFPYSCMFTYNLGSLMSRKTSLRFQILLHFQ